MVAIKKHRRKYGDLKFCDSLLRIIKKERCVHEHIIWCMSMAVTMKDIADIAKVSRGTVDRVLNNRGKVKPEVEARVRQVAEALGYKPNAAAKTFSTLKKKMLFGILLPSIGDDFFEEVIHGIQMAHEELKDYGFEIILHQTSGYDVEKQLMEIDTLLSMGVTAIGFLPLVDERITKKIDEIVASGIPVVTINSDIENSRRNFYVGTDFRKSGKIAAGLLGLVNPKAHVLIITGSSNVLSHKLRYQGFTETISKRYPGIQVENYIECKNDDFMAYDAVRSELAEKTEIDSIFIIAGGIKGVCEGADLYKDRDIKIFCFDAMEYIKSKIIDGRIAATICQQAFNQGYEIVKTVFAWFADASTVKQDCILMENIVQIAENFDD